MYKTLIRKMIVRKIESYAYDHFEDWFFGCVESVECQKFEDEIYFTATYVDNTMDAYFRGFVTENGVLLVNVNIDGKEHCLL